MGNPDDIGDAVGCIRKKRVYEMDSLGADGQSWGSLYEIDTSPFHRGTPKPVSAFARG